MDKEEKSKNPRLIIFASGTKDGGGSGFENLVKANESGILNADIVAVVSNHLNGGVKAIADKYNVRFIHFEKPFSAMRYENMVKDSGAEWVALSGWLKLVQVRKIGFFWNLLHSLGFYFGLDPRRTFNIHPGPLPRFGGAGMYGHHVHEAVLEAYKKGEISESAVSMHFVTSEYDEGPVFFQKPVEILEKDDPNSLGRRVNMAEHHYQPIVTEAVIHGKISWNGKSLTITKGPPF
jgi:phosphoribosylglycinamide formyltransferase 1